MDVPWFYLRSTKSSSSPEYDYGLRQSRWLRETDRDPDVGGWLDAAASLWTGPLTGGLPAGGTGQGSLNRSIKHGE